MPSVVSTPGVWPGVMMEFQRLVAERERVAFLHHHVALGHRVRLDVAVVRLALERFHHLPVFGSTATTRAPVTRRIRSAPPTWSK